MQSIRHYATGGPSSGGSSTALYSGIAAAAGLGGGYYYYSQQKKPNAAEGGAPASKEEQKAVPASTPKSGSFTGGEQGFISLKLDSVEEINHNTKKFRFSLPDKDNVSGLQITCESDHVYHISMRAMLRDPETDTVSAALLTKYQGPEMEKPVIRPYTPTSDGGEQIVISPGRVHF